MSWDYGEGTSASAGGDDWGGIPSQPGQSTVSADSMAYDIGQESAVAGGETQAAPMLPLVVGLVLAGASIVISLVSDSATIASAGWMLGGPLAIGSLAFFLQMDTKRRSHPWYAESSAAPWLRRALVFLAILSVALNAWTIANSVARGTWS